MARYDRTPGDAGCITLQADLCGYAWHQASHQTDADEEEQAQLHADRTARVGHMGATSQSVGQVASSHVRESSESGSVRAARVSQSVCQQPSVRAARVHVCGVSVRGICVVRERQPW